MRPSIRRLLSVAAIGVVLTVPAVSPGSTGLLTGEAQTLLSLPSGNSTEGIAVDSTGAIYVANRRLDDEHVVSEILKVAVDGTVSTFAVLPRSASIGPLGTSGVLGLATDHRGHVYAALVTFDPATHGVWRLDADGSGLARLAGSQQIVVPNGLAFDSRGDLYVTDSLAGSVWRFTGDGPGTPWVQHELLQPLPFDPLGVPLVGANGIAFYPPNHLYVANTERGLIAHIAIDLEDGSAGQPTVAAGGLALLTVDGIAADATGDVHAVVPGYSLLGTAPLVRVDPISGSTAATVNTSEFGEFDVPLSLAFGAGSRDRQSVFVTNGDLSLIPGGPGAGIVQVELGVPGFPIR
jgi:sugar lactone lactonase YvrE